MNALKKVVGILVFCFFNSCFSFFIAEVIAFLRIFLWCFQISAYNTLKKLVSFSSRATAGSIMGIMCCLPPWTFLSFFWD